MTVFRTDAVLVNKVLLSENLRVHGCFYNIVTQGKASVLHPWKSPEPAILHDFTASSRHDDSSHQVVHIQNDIQSITASPNRFGQLSLPYSSPRLWAPSAMERVRVENGAMQISVVEPRRLIIDAYHGLSTKIESSATETSGCKVEKCRIAINIK